MSMLHELFDIRRGDRRNTFAAFGTLLAIATGHTLLETARRVLPPEDARLAAAVDVPHGALAAVPRWWLGATRNGRAGAARLQLEQIGGGDSCREGVDPTVTRECAGIKAIC